MEHEDRQVLRYYPGENREAWLLAIFAYIWPTITLLFLVGQAFGLFNIKKSSSYVSWLAFLIIALLSMLGCRLWLNIARRSGAAITINEDSVIVDEWRGQRRVFPIKDGVHISKETLVASRSSVVKDGKPCQYRLILQTLTKSELADLSELLTQLSRN